MDKTEVSILLTACNSNWQMNLIDYESTFHNIEISLKTVLNLIPFNSVELKKKTDICDSCPGFDSIFPNIECKGSRSRQHAYNLLIF